MNEVQGISTILLKSRLETTVFYMVIQSSCRLKSKSQEFYSHVNWKTYAQQTYVHLHTFQLFYELEPDKPIQLAAFKEQVAVGVQDMIVLVN